MEQDRLPIVQAMIMATTTEGREKQLAKLLPIQRGDFEGIFQAMAGLPVIIRLLDPPLHEFLPSLEELWMPFTANRAFKRAPRMLVAAKDMHYTTADGRQILDMVESPVDPRRWPAGIRRYADSCPELFQ